MFYAVYVFLLIVLLFCVLWANYFWCKLTECKLVIIETNRGHTLIMQGGVFDKALTMLRIELIIP